MNLVQLIKDQLSGEVVSKLSRLTGSGTQETQQAVGAAVPTLLAGLTHLASTPEGARKLNAAVDQMDDRVISNPAQVLAGGAAGGGSGGGGSLIDTGTRMLGSLFGAGGGGGGNAGGGGGMLGGISSALSRFTGMGQERITALLAGLVPMILGVLKSRKQASGLDASGLAGLLSSQKQNIMGAMPSGLGSMLGSIPGLGALTGMTDRAKEAAGSAAETVGAAGSRAAEWTRDTAGSAYDAGRSATREVVGAGRDAASRAGSSSVWKWAVPLLVLIGLGLLAWRLANPRNERAPQALNSPTARNSVPTPAAPEQPQAAQPESAQPQPAAAPSNNGNTPEATLAGAKAAANDAAANATDAAKNAAGNATASVQNQLTDFFRSTTDTFSKITDPDSADQAMPKLRELDTKLDGIRSLTNNLPAGARSSISSMVSQSMEKLNPTIDKVLATPGVGDKIRPTVQEIRDKLNALAQPA